MSTPDELHSFHQRLRNDDELRQHARQRIRCEAYQRDGHWYAGAAHVRLHEDDTREVCFEAPHEAFPTREEAEDFARAFVLHRLQDTAE